MKDLKQTVKNFILENELIGRGETVIAGVSGGADSVCLFHLLRQLGEEVSFDLKVVHINHMIRDSAHEDAEFVQKLCEGYGIDFFLKEIDIPSLVENSGRSEEEVGRDERYRAFEETAGKIRNNYKRSENSAEGENSEAGSFSGEREVVESIVIATAHNQNDLAETMLHNLFRGSRLTGLAGIRPLRMRGDYRLIRPILILERAEIEEYLNENGYAFRTDETNLEDDYTRNRIRHHILPFAEKEINAGAIRHTAQAAAYLGEIDDYLEEQTILAEKRVLVRGKKTADSQSAHKFAYEKAADFRTKSQMKKRVRKNTLKIAFSMT